MSAARGLAIHERRRARGPRLSLLLALVGCTGAPPAAPTLRVMAYNVKHGQGMDGRVDLERVARVIEAAAPDVLTLQEIDQGCGRTGGVDQAAWLGERLGMQAVFGPFMDFDGGRYGMALLSRLPIVASANHPLPAGPEPRSALAARVRLDTGTELVVVGVHLYRSEQERLAQARALVAALKGEAAPVILAGDFNSTPESPVMEFLRGSFASADKGVDALTFDSVSPRVEIDHVLFRPRAALQVMRMDVLEEPLASDHRPLVFEARLESTRP